MKNYFSVILSCLLLFSSCASYNYNYGDSRENRTINIKSENQQEFKVYSLNERVILAETNQGEVTVEIKKFRKKNLSFLVINPNCDTIKLKIKKNPRPKALLKDLFLGVFTFGLPIVVDVFRSDFYQISPKNKLMNVQFAYSQSYMTKKFREIQNSSEPLEFENWLSTYPKSEIYNTVLDHKDSLELEVALRKESEIAIEQFILKHPNSKSLKEAQNIKNEMLASKSLFQETQLKNTVEAYEAFIAKYPRSLQNKEAHLNLVNAAEKEAFFSGSSKELLRYVKEYLVPNRNFLTVKDFDNRRVLLTEEIDKKIVAENLCTDVKKKYDCLSNLWKSYINVKADPTFDILMFFEKTNSYQSEICNLLFVRLKEKNTKSEQKNFIEKSKIDFPNLNVIDSNKNLVITILENSTNKSGTIKLFDVGFIPYLFENMSESHSLIGRKQYNYRGNEYLALEGVDYEEISIQNNSFFGITKCYKKSDLDFSFNMGKNGPLEISYYQFGQLVKTTFFLNNYKEYSYEYQNGTNLTIKSLEEKEKEGNVQLKLGNFDEAISIFQTAINNEYPNTIPVKISISKSLSNAELKKKQYLAKLEADRIIEEKRQRAIQIAEEKARQREMQRLYAELQSTTINYISRFLKNPSGANWVSYNGPEETRRMLNESQNYLPDCENVYATMVTVDASNSWGGIVRSTYVVFFKDNYPCHFEDIKAIDRARNSASRIGDMNNMLSLTLQLNGCGCR